MIQNSKKNEINWNIRLVSLHVSWYPLKIVNLEYGNFLKKVFLEMSYHLRRFMALGPHEECYVHIQGIVCLNMSVLGTNMYPGTVNNVAEETFHFPFTKKSFFNFRVRNGYFL